MRIFAAIAALACLTLPADAFAELRAYDVDAEYRQEVYAALRGILQDRNDRKGRVERLPTGQLLIDATPEVHEQVEAILDTISARQVTAPPQVTLRYWAVLGSPTPGGDSGAPAILNDVLDQIEATHGDLGFRVLGTASLVTESGQSGEIESDPLTVRQLTYAEDDVLNAEIRIRFNYPFYAAPDVFQTRQIQTQHVDLKTTFEPGDIVVIGESTLGENTIRGEQLEGIMFYIVHWPAEQ